MSVADEGGHGILLELAALDLPLRDGWYSGDVGGEKGSFKPEPGDLNRSLVTLSPLVLRALGCFVPPKSICGSPNPQNLRMSLI